MNAGGLSGITVKREVTRRLEAPITAVLRLTNEQGLEWIAVVSASVRISLSASVTMSVDVSLCVCVCPRVFLQLCLPFEDFLETFDFRETRAFLLCLGSVALVLFWTVNALWSFQKKVLHKTSKSKKRFGLGAVQLQSHSHAACWNACPVLSTSLPFQCTKSKSATWYDEPFISLADDVSLLHRW